MVIAEGKKKVEHAENAVISAAGGSDEASGIDGTFITNGGGADTSCRRGQAGADQRQHASRDDFDGRYRSPGSSHNVAEAEGRNGSGRAGGMGGHGPCHKLAA